MDRHRCALAPAASQPIFGRKRVADRPGLPVSLLWFGTAANLRTKILDFRGCDSSIISISRGGILMSIGDFREIMSQ